MFAWTLRLLSSEEEGFEPTICWTNPNIEPVAEHDLRLRTLLLWADSLNVKACGKRWSLCMGKIRCSRSWWKNAVEHVMRRLQESLCSKGAGSITFLRRWRFHLISFLMLAMMCYALCAWLDSRLFGATTGHIIRNATLASRNLGMYRQNYCGCRFSAVEAKCWAPSSSR